MGDGSMSVLLNSAQSRALDQHVITAGTSGFELMTRAADALFQVIQKESPRAKSFVVFTGAGDNAGDGYLLASMLHAAQETVRVVQLKPGDDLQGEARAACEKAQLAGVPMGSWDQAADIDEDVVVDALLGTGASRPPEGDWAEAIRQINASSATVYAVDVPTGLMADTGGASEATVQADHTVSFIARKRGLSTGDGPDYSGEQHFDALGMQEDSLSFPSEELAEKLQWDECSARLPTRRLNTHKGEHGHVWVIGGSPGFAGAAELCARAALRCGVGRVSQAGPTETFVGWPEVMRHAVTGRRDLRQMLQHNDILAVGPGLGRSDWAREMLAAVLEFPNPLILDADALRLLAAEPSQREDWVLTPHPGEAAALLDISTKEVQQDRFLAARTLQQRYGGTVVLKGCGSLIDNGKDPVGACAHGHSGMATAGMGDVLTGIIAALMGQGLSSYDAVCIGVCLHGVAAEDAAQDGWRGMTAGDLLPHLRTRISESQ